MKVCNCIQFSPGIRDDELKETQCKICSHWVQDEPTETKAEEKPAEEEKEDITKQPPLYGYCGVPYP